MRIHIDIFAYHEVVELRNVYIYMYVIPNAFDFCFKRFCTPPVIPSQARESAMQTTPRVDEAGP